MVKEYKDDGICVHFSSEYVLWLEDKLNELRKEEVEDTEGECSKSECDTELDTDFTTECQCEDLTFKWE